MVQAWFGPELVPSEQLTTSRLSVNEAGHYGPPLFTCNVNTITLMDTSDHYYPGVSI